MADELWDEIQNLELGQEDPALFIPHEAYVMVEASNNLSLIARPLNPRVQNLNSVVVALPRSWGLTTQVHGRVLDATYVQFLFANEIDLMMVQRREPWLFNNWFVAATRWQVAPAHNLVTTIDLWVQIRGISLPYVSEETVLEIAQDLGEIISLDFHEATSPQIAFIRVRVRFGITDRLRFFQRIIFDSGETATIRFQYERLRRLCSSCFRFTHNRAYCPYRQRPLSIARERALFCDSVQRSSMNSQSQMTESSFPVPMTPPPRVDPPPMNHSEFVAAYPHLATATNVNYRFTGDSSTSRQDLSSGSNNILPRRTTHFTDHRRCFETGQSSRQNENREPRRPTERMLPPSHFDHVQRAGGILKPPKKR
ncbi:hypothetical protein AtNW77_Chr5g0109771 [Arabidopsis thaliana]|uniref:Zinc knuckle CX2CX4HX4C n=1 Tax=Arabidopsis thaliana x Arabidopsis arenosa TaxID=1240361 RepID=A0A8T2CV35_9BRAS|nr:Zinc knuckle CX2CX4HX4C [Arabidopsis thaliana x Arabidopsis arenosa]